MNKALTQSVDTLPSRIASVREQLAEACAAAGRDSTEITLIAVTKNHPPELAAEAVRCGLLELGENKPQELALKSAGVAELDATLGQRATWHFIGRLQRNKAKQVVAHADLVHSIDRIALADTVAAAAGASERWSGAEPLPVLLQVNLDPGAQREEHDSTASRGGVHPEEILRLAAHIGALDELRIAGLMAIAPLGMDPDPCFARLYELSLELRVEHPAADIVSAGMSGDFAAAIANGATHVRVGTALFGARTLA